MIDNLQFGIKGEIKFKLYKNGKLTEDYKQNIVLSQSKHLIRNLIFGDGNVITKIKIGDMNKKIGDDCRKLSKPNKSDKDLVHEFFQKKYDKHIKVEDKNGNPAIKYVFEIEESEANDLSNSDLNRKLWCEFGLAQEDNTLWTRVIKPIIKDRETKIIIEYILTITNV